MTPFRERAKDGLPTVLLTLASIIQALSLEFFWTRISSDAPYLWQHGPFFWTGWIQAAAVFVGILVIWVYYAGLVMRFRWVPQVRDSVIPFIFGIGEFALVETMGPQGLTPWFLLYAFIFAFAGWSSHSTLGRARQDEDNTAFFVTVNRSRLSQHGPQLIPSTIFCAFAWGAAYVEPTSGAILTCMLIAVGFVLMQLWLQGVYWQRTLAIDEQPPNQDA